ncbi:hypothetical protein [Microbacterium sp. H83]|uniref:hypothetical protein n=1 Tax=Microbacterium sp. H83 TaxID=1827324 RepID=UPI0007F343C1|nr:hypothetical protein [Microbacterium sp. H83]OAN41376.1 hypothetical protein A4X16_11035 [Microbacterium sp. H83]
MGGARTGIRTHVEVDGRDFLLGGDRDLVHVMSQIEAAAASPPAFVDLSDGDEMVSVLIHGTSRVVVSVEREHRPPEPLDPPTASIDDWEM